MSELMPSLPQENTRENILEIEHIKKYFRVKEIFARNKKFVKAVDDVSFTVRRNETYSIVGETGCGKSTLGRMVMQLITPTAGRVLYEGVDITEPKNMTPQIRRELQIIFQDPYSSLNPRMTIGQILEEPMRVYKLYATAQERRDKCLELLEKVGMKASHYYRYPHEFSGGQRQRIVILRALILDPKVIVCDEPVSALDVSIRSQILNFLVDIKKTMGVTLIFISHDMSVIRYISDRIGVMYLGHIVEEAPCEELFSNPQHPYTQALLSAVPELDPHQRKKVSVLSGETPSPIHPPSGCTFHPRCPKACAICSREIPPRYETGAGHYAFCHLLGDLCPDPAAGGDLKG